MNQTDIKKDTNVTCILKYNIKTQKSKSYDTKISSCVNLDR